MPHGMCYLWQPGILSLHVIADSSIALAYLADMGYTTNDQLTVPLLTASK